MMEWMLLLLASLFIVLLAIQSSKGDLRRGTSAGRPVGSSLVGLRTQTSGDGHWHPSVDDRQSLYVDFVTCSVSLSVCDIFFHRH